MVLAVELLFFSKMIHTKPHSKESSERNFILARVVALGIFKGNFYVSCKTSLVSFELICLLIKNLQAEYGKSHSL